VIETVRNAKEVSTFVMREIGERNAGFGHAGIGWRDERGWIGGVVYENLEPGQNVWMSTAVHPERRFPWFAFVEAFLYPFVQLSLPRVSSLVSILNDKALLFDTTMGWQYEGMMRRAGKMGEGVLVLGMLKEECRFIRDPYLSKYKRKLDDESLHAHRN